MRAFARQFIFETRHAAVITGIVVAALITVPLLMLRVYETSTAPWYFSSPRAYLGMLILIVLVPTYLFSLSIPSIRRTRELAVLIDTMYQTRLVEKIERLPRGKLFLAAMGGALFALLFNIPGNGRDFFDTNASGRFVTLGQILIWVLVACFLFIRIRIAVAFSEASQHAPVDIFEPGRLRPFAQVGLIDVLVVAGAIVISTIQSLDLSFRYDQYTKALAVALPAMVFLALQPMWNLHQRMKRMRAEELATLNARILDASKALETDRMNELEVLLQRRERVKALSTWPVDISILQRFFFYIIIPPLAWVGAALVEFLLARYIN